MDVTGVKAAAEVAKRYIESLFDDQELASVCLEEVVYADVSGEYDITIGFERKAALMGPAFLRGAALGERVYKVVRVDSAGQVKSVLNREPAAA